MYTCHYDWPNEQWNVFEVVDGHEIYLRFFPTADEAMAFCNSANVPANQESR
jgi:hypothetical protein